MDVEVVQVEILSNDGPSTWRLELLSKHRQLSLKLLGTLVHSVNLTLLNNQVVFLDYSSLEKLLKNSPLVNVTHYD